MLSKISQRAFEKKNPNLDFLQIFGIRYLEPDEDFWPDVNEAMKNGSKLQRNVQKTQKDARKTQKVHAESKIEFIETELGELPF